MANAPFLTCRSGVRGRQGGLPARDRLDEVGRTAREYRRHRRTFNHQFRSHDAADGILQRRQSVELPQVANPCRTQLFNQLVVQYVPISSIVVLRDIFLGTGTFAVNTPRGNQPRAG